MNCIHNVVLWSSRTSLSCITKTLYPLTHISPFSPSSTPHSLMLGQVGTWVNLPCSPLGRRRNPSTREKPRGCGENGPTPHRQWPPLGTDIFFSHQHYYKKMTLFEDLRYSKPSLNHLPSLSYFKRQRRHRARGCRL